MSELIEEIEQVPTLSDEYVELDIKVLCAEAYVEVNKREVKEYLDNAIVEEQAEVTKVNDTIKAEVKAMVEGDITSMKAYKKKVSDLGLANKVLGEAKKTRTVKRKNAKENIKDKVEDVKFTQAIIGRWERRKSQIRLQRGEAIKPEVRI